MDILTILSTSITIVSLAYAIKTNREKKKFEKLVQGRLAEIAGTVWKSAQSADWSDKNFSRARDAAYKLDDSDKKQDILKHIHNGARDAVAAKRMLSNLLSEVVSMQKSMFGTETITHLERS